jgi:1-aminocyclopropane-1-carboxylate deaminase
MLDRLEEHLSPSPIQVYEINGIKIHVKRDDLIHPLISGNKSRKLKYHLLKANDAKCDTLITFGGAFSNHVAAVAKTAELCGLKSIGIIRGEHADVNNVTLKTARESGMELIQVGIDEYNERNNYNYHDQLKLEYPGAHIIPEGGAGSEGISGAMEIIKELDQFYDYIVCAVGTGTTAAGFILSKPAQTKILCMNVFKKAAGLKETINANLNLVLNNKETICEYENDFKIVDGYGFGGYAKVNNELKDFVGEIYRKYNLPLDLVYTGKAFYGLLDLIKNEKVNKNSRILFYHSGGLQGNAGFGFGF